MIPTIYTGISTILFYKVISDDHAEDIIDEWKCNNDVVIFHEKTHIGSVEYKNLEYEDRGFIVTLFKSCDAPWGVYVYVSPALLMKQSTPNGLLPSRRKECKSLITHIDKLLRKTKSGLRCKAMKLSQMSIDLRLDLHNSWMPLTYLDVIRKGFLPRHYQDRPFGESDTRCAASVVNNHACRFSCKTVDLLVGDAKAFGNIDNGFRWTEGAIPDKTELCFQIRLSRRAIRRNVKGKTLKKHSDALASLAGQSEQLIANLLDRMKLLEGRFVCYAYAKKMISEIKRKGIKRKLTELTNLIHQGASLTEASETVQQMYGIDNRRRNWLFRKYKKLGISPVILPDSSKDDLPPLDMFLKKQSV